MPSIPFFSLFLKYQVPHLLPWYVLAAQVRWESAYDPSAISSAGAQGLAQFMPSTWAEVGDGDPFDPEASIRAQAKYMTYLCEFVATVAKPGLAWAICAYTWGPGNVKRAKTWTDVPIAVKRHVKRVLKEASAMQNTHASLSPLLLG